MKTITLLLLTALVSSVTAGPIREVALLTSSWVMLESISNSAGDKQNEFYQNSSFTVKSDRWHNAAMELQVPFVYVTQTGGDGVERSRAGFADIILVPSYARKFITASCGISIPTGYGYDTSGKESLWLGPGSVSLRPQLGFSGYHAPLRLAQGLELSYLYYLNDGAVGWGSWSAGAKGYLAHSRGKLGYGTVFEYGFKSINYYKEGILKESLKAGKGYGEPLEQADVTGGLFASYPLPGSSELAAGVSYTLYAHESPVGAGMWVQLKKFLK